MSTAGTSATGGTGVARGLVGEGVVLLLLWSGLAMAQGPREPGPPSQPPTSVAGQVVDVASGTGVVGVLVELWHSGAPLLLPGSGSADGPGRWRQTTDDHGRFRFAALTAGSYRIHATAPGYLSGGYSPVHVATRPYEETSWLDVQIGERLEDLTIWLWSAGELRGQVRDQAGNPLVRVSIQLLRRAVEFGRVHWRIANNPVLTDDRGGYAFDRLAPGEYVVVLPRQREGWGQIENTRASRALSPSETAALERRTDGLAPDALVIPTVFYPGSPGLREATVITVRAGERREGVDLVASPRANEGPLTFSGRVVDGDGRPLDPGPTVRLLRADVSDDLTHLEGFVTTVAPDGTFSMAGLAPGAYRFVAWQFPSSGTNLTWGGLPSRTTIGATGYAPLPAAPTWTVDLPLQLESSRRDVVVPMHAAGHILGQADIDPAAPQPPRDLLPKVAAAQFRWNSAPRVGWICS